LLTEGALIGAPFFWLRLNSTFGVRNEKTDFALALTSLVAACGDDDETPSNNTTGETNNSTTGETNNSTTGETNNSTGTNNATSTNNATNNATNNETSNSTNNHIDPPATRCELYCSGFAEVCAAQFAADYTDNGGCLTECAGFDMTNTNNVTGKLACRSLHLEQAATDPETHCPQAGLVPTGGCD